MLWIVLIAGVVLFWVIPRFYLSGPDLGRYDHPHQPPLRETSSDARHGVVTALGVLLSTAQGPRRGRLQRLRLLMDGFGDNVVFDGEIRPVQAGTVPAEWVLARGADPARRLLYVHGGAFAMGSPKSHRRITTTLSRQNGAAVLAIDYRLLPEHTRDTGIGDCQQAYRWILEHGPDGPSAAATVFVAGDSAGGNLTLMLLAWARDHGLRAPTAAVALSPATDVTMSSPSLRHNIATDPMLGPMFGALARIPHPLLLLFAWFSNRRIPRHPLISPVYGDLAGLPPLLVHASESEMLVDDARRYVNKARAAGSPVELETWPDMVHVWHFFADELPEGTEAYARISAFLNRVAPRS